MAQQSKQKNSRMVIEGDLTLNRVENIHATVLSLVKTSIQEDAEIEFRSIQKWDVSAIQLFYSLKRHYALHGHTLSFTFSSPEQKELCKEWIDLLNSQF